MNGKPYTKQEEAKLRELYPNTSSHQIADILNKDVKSIYAKATKLGLKKSIEYMQTTSSGRISKGERISITTEFKKGSIPSNKGTKGIMKANRTSFVKGQIPANHKPIGSERITKDGYIEIKISEPNKWALKHRVIWQKYNGQIPKGYIVVFNDNDKLNVFIDNLRLITLKENMQRNSIMRFPEELRKTIKAVSKLKKQILTHG